MLLVDDHIDDSSEQVLQGQKIDRYSLTKVVDVKNVQPNIKSLLASQENKLLAEKTKLGLWFFIYFIYLGFYVAFNTVQVIS